MPVALKKNHGSKFRYKILIFTLAIAGIFILLLSEYRGYRKKQQFLQKIEDKERVFTLFSNDIEITDEDFFDLWQKDQRLQASSEDGDIVGYRRYRYGKLLDEKYFRVSKDTDGYITLHIESTSNDKQGYANCILNPNSQINYTLLNIRSHYYHIAPAEERKFYRRLFPEYIHDIL